MASIDFKAGGMSPLHLNQALRAGRAEAPKTKDLKELERASIEFEAMLTQAMYDSMRESVAEGGLVEKGNGEKIFTSMLDREFAMDTARQGTMGLAKKIYESMKAHVR